TYNESFSGIMQNLVLEPLKMVHSTFQQPLPIDQLKRAAMPYKTDGTPVIGGPHTYVEQAAAGLWTTPTDLANFLISIQKSLRGDENQVLDLHFASLMTTPAINKTMGLGFAIGVNKFGKPEKDGQYFMHEGENEGYKNIVIGNI